MADYIFDDWKTMLGSFQDCVQKDLEEIHKQKAEIQQMKADLYKEMEGFKYYRDEQCLILSAPKVIIGNVDESGDLISSMGEVIIKGQGVELNGVGETGRILSRAPIIQQTAVDPGSDGMENVVCETSVISSQASTTACATLAAATTSAYAAIPSTTSLSPESYGSVRTTMATGCPTTSGSSWQGRSMAAAAISPNMQSPTTAPKHASPPPLGAIASVPRATCLTSATGILTTTIGSRGYKAQSTPTSARVWKTAAPMRVASQISRLMIGVTWTTSVAISSMVLPAR